MSFSWTFPQKNAKKIRKKIRKKNRRVNSAEVKLAANVSIAWFRVEWENTAFAAAYDLQASDNGIDWTTVFKA